MKKEAGYGFWFLWTGINAIGWFVGGYIFYFFITSVAAAAPLYGSVIVWYGIFAIAGMICGSIPGILQWIILRVYISGIGKWWFLTCAIGVLPFVWNAGLSFAVMGILQWLILRRYTSETIWWVLATLAIAGVASLIPINEMLRSSHLYFGLSTIPLLFIGNSAIMGVTLLGLWPK